MPLPFSFSQSIESEIGYDALWNANSKANELSRPYVLQKFAGEVASLTTDKKLTFTGSYRLRGKKPIAHPDGQYQLEMRSLHLEAGGDFWHLIAGLQEVIWGEAFGLPVADVINPYDLTEYSLAQRSESRIPLAMLNTVFNQGPFSLQLIYVPLPRRSPDPEIGDGIEQIDPPKYRMFKDSEYGGRIGYLHSSGLDLKPFYYSHWSRWPVYSPQIFPEGLRLGPVESRVQSYGLSFSQAFQAVVVRSDVAEHRNIPIFNPKKNTVEFYTQQQATIGADYNLDSGQGAFGGQLQVEDGTPRPSFLERGPLVYGALRMTGSFFNAALAPELLNFRGINNSDSWIQAKLSWYLPADLTVTVNADWVFQGEHGHPFYFIPQRRTFSRLSYRF